MCALHFTILLFIQEKWANFHGSWGKRVTDPDYEEVDAVIEQLIPIQQVTFNNTLWWYIAISTFS